MFFNVCLDLIQAQNNAQFPAGMPIIPLTPNNLDEYKYELSMSGASSTTKVSKLTMIEISKHAISKNAASLNFGSSFVMK